MTAVRAELCGVDGVRLTLDVDGAQCIRDVLADKAGTDVGAREIVRAIDGALDALDDLLGAL